MSIQLASFVGSNLFTAADAPRYRKALLICAGCVLAASALCLVWKILYRYVGTRQDEEEENAPSSSTEEVKVV